METFTACSHHTVLDPGRSTSPAYATDRGCLAGSDSESVSGEETGGRFSKLLWKLKMRAMPRIREENEPGVVKILLKDERIHGRDHDVVVTVHHESPVRDVLQRAVALAGHLPPCLQRGQLGGGDLRRCEQAMPCPRPGLWRSVRRTTPASVRPPCCSADQ
jgi:hypothetical protein